MDVKPGFANALVAVPALQRADNSIGIYAGVIRRVDAAMTTWNWLELIGNIRQEAARRRWRPRTGTAK